MMLPIKLTREDFQRLRRELITFAAITVFAIAFHFGSNYLEQSLLEKVSNAQAQLNEAHSQLSLVQQELTDLHRYLPRYQRLIAEHIIGDEQRLEWIETLESIQANLHLPGLKYDFDPRRPLAAPVGLTLMHHKLLTSPMKLEVFTLHEEQLVNTLEAIHQRVVGLPVLRGCEMTPTSTGNARTATQCQYDWITLTIGSEATSEQAPQ